MDCGEYEVGEGDAGVLEEGEDADVVSGGVVVVGLVVGYYAGGVKLVG